jgi:hypothetical protein
VINGLFAKFLFYDLVEQASSNSRSKIISQIQCKVTILVVKNLAQQSTRLALHKQSL